MLLGIIATAIAIAGIVYGAVNRRRWLTIGSTVLLVLVLAVWWFFWSNPY